MTDSKRIWMLLWDLAARDSAPFEIDEAAPDVARALGIDLRDAERMIGGLLKELERLPDGKQYFTREGNAVVSLGEFHAALSERVNPLDAYPFEL